MSHAYKSETITQNGKQYHVCWYYDDDTGDPWDYDECHGPVSDWVRRAKRPGELVLTEDWGNCRYYDFEGAVKKARAEGWNVAPYDWKTKGEQAAAAARADFEYLRRWCNDQWRYCRINVTLIGDDGEFTDIDSELGGIEDDGAESVEYHNDVIQDLIYKCDCQHDRTVYPVTNFGI